MIDRSGGVSGVKHFFYAVYVLFYTGAVFMAGIFIGQMLYRSRTSRKTPSSELAAWPTGSSTNGEARLGEPRIAATGRKR